MKKINVLISGCGGDLGASIARICKESGMFAKVVGCNNNERHFSKHLVDKHYLVSNFGTDEYRRQIRSIVDDEKIDLVVPVSELEIRLIAEDEKRNSFGKTPFLIANKNSLDIGLDKLKTVNFLKKIGAPYPDTYIFKEMQNRLNYPYIIKSRNGYGSKTVFLIKNDKEKKYYLEKYPEFVAQEYLDVSESEYTCGLFSNSDGTIVRSIVLRRNLYEGTTSDGQVVSSKEIESLLKIIAKNINLVGSINVQLRVTEKGPVVFEINPRFSSTVRFRDLMGFKDFIWSVQDIMSCKIDEYIPPFEGMRFYRESNERVISDSAQ